MREIAIKCLVGSHNYNLNTESSDKDYKIFCYPTFEDLYTNTYYHESVLGEKEDYDCHDIRRLPELLIKSNPNYLEVLFSKEYAIIVSEIKDFFDFYRGRIAKMNLPKLWSSLFGLGIQKSSKLIKGTEGTKHLVKQFGYDTKQAMHAHRAYNMIDTLVENGFDFKNALWMDDVDRWGYIGIKNGIYELKEIEFSLECKKVKAKSLEDNFKNQPVDLQMMQILRDFIKNQVKNRISNY